MKVSDILKPWKLCFVQQRKANLCKRNSIDSKKSTAGYSSGLDWECLISDVHVSIDFYSIPKEEGEYIYLFSEIWLVKKYERVYLGEKRV